MNQDTTSPTAQIQSEEPAKPPVTKEDRMKVFRDRFNELCADTGVNSAAIVLDHSQPGQINIQAHGHVPTIQYLGQLLDKTAMAAHLQADRRERKAAEFAKRNGNAG